ncbi:MAG: 30S ribosomal protein S1 [Firmicutes bacterium]|nr:30S ribosomal protein S1 [candidate division NPL-UPA2 bacterium]MBT9155838.1 30S ribosomal protein S1 [candidate division NPL-UPA2 bacterium]
MRVLKAYPTGMCRGVMQALELAQEVAGRHGYSLGPVVHNPQVADKLRDAGLAESSIDEVPPGSEVLIRSHGALPSVYELARERNLRIVDATCPHVLRLQRETALAVADGWEVVLVGDVEHPEVQAVLGHAGGAVRVVRDEAELAAQSLSRRVAVLAQTTTPVETWQAAVNYLRLGGHEVKPVKTICVATQERQLATYQLAAQVDIMVIVGGNNSANTKNLAALCSRVGTPTYQVETPDQLDPAWFVNKRIAGVAAGASTPEWIIKEVVVAMENMENKLPEVQETAAEEITAASESAHFTTLKRGQLVEGRVVSADAEGVQVDIGQKSEGYISKSELSHDPNFNPVEMCPIGETISAVVLRIDGKEDKIFLSRRRASEEQGMKDLRVARESGAILQGKIVEAVKGGVMVDVIGIKAFMPASHVDLRYVPDLNAYIGQTVSVLIKEIEEPRRRVVVSRKEALEKKTEELKTRTWEGLIPGHIRDGVVQRLTDFGAFVDLGGVDGLVHVSEIAWQRVSHPQEALTVGQEVKVKILGVDREKGRVSLSIKQGEGDPWNKISDMFAPGAIVPGRIVRTASFGAFVEIAPGIEGLVHISQLAHERVEKTEDAVKPGDQVTVKILSIVPAEHRVSLSIKEAQDRPPQQDRSDRPERGERSDRRERGERRGRDDRNHSYREESKVTLGDVFGELLKEKK